MEKKPEINKQYDNFINILKLHNPRLRPQLQKGRPTSHATTDSPSPNRLEVRTNNGIQSKSSLPSTPSPVDNYQYSNTDTNTANDNNIYK